MKRLVYLFAVALVLQFSWGVASAYCLHETGQASQHFGHHEHQHEVSQDGADDNGSSAPKKSPVHPDCATCAHHIAIVPLLAVDSILGIPASHDLLSPILLPSSPFLGAPERPQWTVAA